MKSAADIARELIGALCPHFPGLGKSSCLDCLAPALAEYGDARAQEVRDEFRKLDEVQALANIAAPGRRTR